jgi:transposase
MPWKVTDLVDQRTQFVKDYLTKRHSMTELCRIYRISRQTGYECLQRFQREGWQGLQEHSHAPLRHPNQTPEKLEQQILQLRREYPRWGPRKLRGHLVSDSPQINWPTLNPFKP